jgi:hypothetical protein
VADSEFRPRKSKLDDHLDIVGKLSDREVAAIAGVTTENVRMYRVRRNIAAAWKGEGGGATPAPPAPKATKAKAAATSPDKRRGRKGKKIRRPSRLDPWKELIGQVPDRDVAQKAGTTAENVRMYRVRRGIAAAWKSGEAGAVPAASASAPRRGRPPGSGRGARGGRAKAAEAISRRWGWKVVAESGAGDAREWLVLAGTVEEAAKLAAERLRGQQPGATLRSIARVGEAL